jgi:hypothetical protein
MSEPGKAHQKTPPNRTTRGSSWLGEKVGEGREGKREQGFWKKGREEKEEKRRGREAGAQRRD